MSILALEEDVEANITHFAHRAEFLTLLAAFLEKLDENDDQNLDDLVKPMGAILDQYLSLPGLLDPALNEIVGPLMQRMTACLRDLARNQCQPQSGPILIATGRLINWVIKVRGWKAVVPQFPSDIHFLPLLANLLSPPSSPSSSRTPATPHHPLLSTDEAWEVRSVLLLWLSLLLTVPFNLSALSSNTSPTSYSIDYTAQQRLFAVPAAGLARQVILLAVPLLYRPGREGAYAALVLARLYSREDAAPGLPGFMDWAGQELEEGEREGEANLVASVFEFLAILPTLIRPERLNALAEFTDDVLLPHLRGSRTAASSGLIRKLAIKAKGRWWVARIGSNPAGVELPDSIEDLVGDLMSGLGDKDTIVRYSAAKYLARITSILPEEFQNQIIGATLALFGGTDDEPVIESSFGTIVDPGGSGSGGTMGFGGAESMRGDARWHGVCLALAELARRGLLQEEIMAETVTWVLKALSFDLRRASHSVGANVRDAAAYLLWSLSRACSSSVFEPFAAEIATALIRAACFDREVGVRRAASAAFQEGVGRLGLYPEGIDVLGKTDFYSVSVRRIAFTTAAPAVATHRVYRDALRQHLHDISLRHWDKNIRDLGSRALRDIVKIGGNEDLHDAIAKEIDALRSVDPHSIHGGLLALRELATALGSGSDESLKTMIFDALGTIRPSALVTASAADVLQAVCEVIFVTATPSILAAQAAQEQISHITQTTMRRTESDCQDAVARLFGLLSRLRSPHTDVSKLRMDLKSSRAAIRQSSALSLGCIQYVSCSELSVHSIESLLYQLDPISKADVETRRYALRSLANIAIQPLSLSRDIILAIIQAAVKALSDYSTDQRGDIGSWIRITGLAGLGQMLSVPRIHSQMDPDLLDSAIGGIIKQGVEKLEPCRSQAYTTMIQLRQSGVQWAEQEAMNFDGGTSTPNFREITQLDWFMSAMPLLRTKYCDSLVAGLVISIGSSIPSVSKTSFQALSAALVRNPDLISEVIGHLSRLLAANLNVVRVFVPTMSSITQILLSDVPSVKGATTALELHAPRIVSSASRGISTVKSIERLTASLKLCIAILPLRVRTCQEKVIDAIEAFLTHRFPRIRAVTAEQLYLKLSEDDVDPDLEEVLLETAWTDDGVNEEVTKVTALLRSTLASH